MAQSLNMLPRTVASFYGSAVPRPYVVHDAAGEVKQDRVAKPRVNAALVAWAAGQAWSRGGLLADAVLRNAGRTADAAGRRKLQGEEEDEGDADALGAPRAAKPRAARKAGSKRRSRSAGSTPARKRSRKVLEQEEEEEAADWDEPESEEDEDEAVAASDSDDDGEGDSDDEDGGARRVAETPARLAALRPGTGALVRAPAAFKRLRRANASPLPPPHTTPSVAAPPTAQTPAAPARWRLKGTKRMPGEPSPRVRPEATPHRSASAWSTPTPAKSLARTPNTSVKKQKAEKRRRRL